MNYWIILHERGMAPEPDLLKCTYCELDAIEHNTKTQLNYCLYHLPFMMKDEREMERLK